MSVLGGDIKEYQILIHPQKMKHFGVSLSDVLNATTGMNQNTNGGTIYEYGNEYIIRGLVSSDNIEDIGDAVVKSTNNIPVTLADIAEVKVGPKPHGLA